MLGRLEFWAEYLYLSQNMTNVTLVPVDGQHKETHALLLASVSEFLASLLLEIKDIKEKTVILLPDFTMEDVEDCLQFILTGDLNDASLIDSLCIPHDSSVNGRIELDIINTHNEIDDVEKDFKGEPIKFEVYDILKGENDSMPFQPNDNTETNSTLILSENKTAIKTKMSPRRDFKRLLKPDKVFQCKDCPHFYSTELALKKHQRNTPKHANISYEEEDWVQYVEILDTELKCKICGNFSANHNISNRRRRKIREHIYLKHKINQKLPCLKCDKMFHYQWDLNKHLLHHEDIMNTKAVCNKCGIITAKTFLREHVINIHGTEEEKIELKKFHCSNCDKRYRSKINLKVHKEQSHGDGTIYQCTECNYNFKSNFRLDIHFRKTHIQEIYKKPKTEEFKAKQRAFTLIYRARKRERNGGIITERERENNRKGARNRRERRILQNVINNSDNKVIL